MTNGTVEALPVVRYENGKLIGFDDMMAYVNSLDFPQDLTVKANLTIVTKQRATINKFLREAHKAAKKGRNKAVVEWEQENHKAFAVFDTLKSIEEDLGESILAEQNARLASWLPQLDEVVAEQNKLRELDDDHKLTTTRWRLLGSFTPTGKLKNSVVNEIVKEADLQKYKQNEPVKLTEKQVFAKALAFRVVESWKQIDDDGVYSGSEVKQLIEPIKQYILDNNK